MHQLLIQRSVSEAVLPELPVVVLAVLLAALLVVLTTVCVGIWSWAKALQCYA